MDAGIKTCILNPAEREGEEVKARGEWRMTVLGPADYDQPTSSSSPQISEHDLRFSTAP